MPKETKVGENADSGLCYVPYFGWIPAVGYLVFSKDNKIKWNACQSLLMHLLLIAIYFVTLPLMSATGVLSPLVSSVGGIFGVIFLVTALYVLVKTYEGTVIRVPIVAEWADKMLEFVKN